VHFEWVDALSFSRKNSDVGVDSTVDQIELQKGLQVGVHEEINRFAWIKIRNFIESADNWGSRLTIGIKMWKYHGG